MPIKTKPSGEIPFLLNYQPYELPLGVEPVDDINDMISFNFEIPKESPVINYYIGSVREDFVNLVIKNITRDTVLRVFLDYDNQTFTIKERDTNIEPRPIVTPSDIKNLPNNNPVVVSGPTSMPEITTPTGDLMLTPQQLSAPSLQPRVIVPEQSTQNISYKTSADNVRTQPINDAPRSIAGGIISQPITDISTAIINDITTQLTINDIRKLPTVNSSDIIREQLVSEADLRSQPVINRERRVESAPIILRGETSATFMIKYNKQVLNAYTDYTAFSTLIQARIQNVFDGKLCTRNVAVALPSKERFQPKITVV